MDPSTLPPRDLVMKGGITSGVVYPGAARELAKHYRFRKIGGSSAGAIAAAVCAAAEYGRQRGQGAGMRQLDAITADLGKDGFLLSLFQPAPGARDLWEIATAVARRRGDPPLALAFQASLMALRRAPRALVPFAALLLLLGGAFAAVAASAGAVAWIVVGVLAAVVAGVGLAASGGWALARVVAATVRALPDSHYGLCPGSSPDTTPALVEWLHRHIQEAAGLELDCPPLTFGELERAGIGLAMTTTDLSYARPIPVPLPEETYLFDPRVWRHRFPRSVVNHMIHVATGAEPVAGDWERTHFLPRAELPVIVGVRLSLSFPLLLSAMPLHAYWTMRETPERVNLFSDGGICSNFPIHFFDAWFPQTPTFGLDLVDLPGYESGADAGEPRIGDPAEPAPPRWSQVSGLGAFLGQVKDAMQNWRDALQSELPGFRDRVCQVPLGEGLGGLNLQMTPDQIRALELQGEKAARILHSEFRWERHRFIRYLTLMQLLQQNLHALAGPAAFPSFAESVASGIPGGEPFAAGHGPAWGAPARQQTEALLALAARWGQEGEIDFAQEPVPDPIPTMRVVPPG